MPSILTRPGRLLQPSSFPFGYGLTWITRDKPQSFERDFIDFGILRLETATSHRFNAKGELLLVLLHGESTVTVAGRTTTVRRSSLFDEAPSAIHCGAGTLLTVTSQSKDTEWAVLQARNSRFDGIRWLLPEDTVTEDRGAGLAQDACRRLVRTLFDYKRCPTSQLVVGEVVNRAGRWSSYPPHHHPQPEVYHYRFTQPQGYGHAEVGDHVFKVRNGETVEIPGAYDHAQVAAPGYGMYYLWAVRHLPRRPYKGFNFTPAHTWLLDPRQQGWTPS